MLDTLLTAGGERGGRRAEEGWLGGDPGMVGRALVDPLGESLEASLGSLESPRPKRLTDGGKNWGSSEPVLEITGEMLRPDLSAGRCLSAGRERGGDGEEEEAISAPRMRLEMAGRRMFSGPESGEEETMIKDLRCSLLLALSALSSGET
jgi:hypothetical protein